jgi:ribose-phosphate pyrophosphokinase
MMKINKDSYFLFSGGEVHCKLGDCSSRITVTDYTMNGFMTLAEQVEILRRLGKEHIDVIYPYFPYARQDRVMAQREPFSLKIFAELVNGLKLDYVEVWDPHSDVVPALLNECVVIPQWDIAKRAIPDEYFANENVIFVSPDAGAYKKLSKLIPDDQRIAIGVKNRDTLGKITGTNFYSPVSVVGRTCVIVDDICDGGRTFIELAKKLKEAGAAVVVLYITHGIFSQGLEPLREHIDFIYTTNSFPNEDIEGFMKIYKIL